MTDLSTFNGCVQLTNGARVVSPTCVADVQELVRQCHDERTPVHTMGNRNSFNEIMADLRSNVTILDLRTHLNRIATFHRADETCDATSWALVEAGISLQELCHQLATQHGVALKNVPNFGGLTLGGVVATGVHGTTGRDGCDTLSSSILFVDLIDGKGHEVRVSREDSVTLGFFGVIVRVALIVVPLYHVHHRAYALASADVGTIESWKARWLTDIDTHDRVMYKFLIGEHEATMNKETFDRVRVDPEWMALQWPAQIWNDTKTTLKYNFPANATLTNIPWRASIYNALCERDQVQVYYQAMMGPPHVSAHVELEWCLSWDEAFVALADIDRLVRRLRRLTPARLTQPVECHVRFSPPDVALGHLAYVASSELCKGTPSKDPVRPFVWIDINVRQELEDAPALLASIESILIRCRGRPHWSKLWCNQLVAAAVRAQSGPFIQRLRNLCRMHDPVGLFHSHTFARNLLKT